jgi:hypothetical protein
LTSRLKPKAREMYISLDVSTWSVIEPTCRTGRTKPKENHQPRAVYRGFAKEGKEEKEEKEGKERKKKRNVPTPLASVSV